MLQGAMRSEKWRMETHTDAHMQEMKQCTKKERIRKSETALPSILYKPLLGIFNETTQRFSDWLLFGVVFFFFFFPLCFE